MEISDRLREPDFQIRANKFVNEIRKLAGSYREVAVSCENTTLAKIESSSRSAGLFKKVKMFDEASRVTKEGHASDTESSYRNVVNLSAWSDSNKQILDFLAKADSVARRLNGEKDFGGMIKDNGEDAAEGNRFGSEREYYFS